MEAFRFFDLGGIGRDEDDVSDLKIDRWPQLIGLGDKVPHLHLSQPSTINGSV